MSNFALFQMFKMLRSVKIILAALLIVLALSKEKKHLYAQNNSGSGGFTIARLHYGGGGDWYANPSSVPNLLNFIADNTNIHVNLLEVRVKVSEEALFSYPYIYMTGHGNVRLSDDEVERLRTYLTSGGFLHADDNYGMNTFFRREMKKVFPEKDWVHLPFNHEIFHNRFSFPEGIPKIHEHDGGPGQGLALFHEGRIVVFYSFNTDLGDGWEDADVHNDPSEVRLSALEMGTNIVVYALTH